MNAFIDVNGVLVAFGYMESNNDDQLIEVPDDFYYTPGTVWWDGSSWLPYVPPVIPPTRAEIENMRRLAYSDHAMGSFRFFSEAEQLLAMGGSQTEADSLRAKGTARAQEIQAEYPLP